MVEPSIAAFGRRLESGGAAVDAARVVERHGACHGELTFRPADLDPDRRPLAVGVHVTALPEEMRIVMQPGNGAKAVPLRRLDGDVADHDAECRAWLDAEVEKAVLGPLDARLD